MLVSRPGLEEVQIPPRRIFVRRNGAHERGTIAIPVSSHSMLQPCRGSPEKADTSGAEAACRKIRASNRRPRVPRTPENRYRLPEQLDENTPQLFRNLPECGGCRNASPCGRDLRIAALP